MNCKKLFLMVVYMIVGLVFKKDVTLFDKSGLTQFASCANSGIPTNDG